VVQGERADSGWYRVFGRNEVEPAPAALLEHLRVLGLEVRPAFRGDDLGWFAADFAFDDDTPPLQLERFLTREEGLRSELNAWAAWLETVEHNPNHAALMERVIQTSQLFTLRQPAERMESLCVAVSRFLARVTDGVYQADGQGFFAADGTLLLPEN
jgi:hypothetical protein